MLTDLFLGIGICILFAVLFSLLTPGSSTSIPMPMPARPSSADIFAYDPSPESILIYAHLRMLVALGRSGGLSNDIAALRIWGDGRLIRARYEEQRRSVFKGYLTGSQIRELLHLLDQQRHHGPAPAEPGKHELMVNLLEDSLRAWRDPQAAYELLTGSVDKLPLSPFVPQEALLKSSPYSASQPPLEQMPAWPAGHGFSLASLQEHGRWISGELLELLWRETNEQALGQVVFREGARAYAILLTVRGL